MCSCGSVCVLFLGMCHCITLDSSWRALALCRNIQPFYTARLQIVLEYIGYVYSNEQLTTRLVDNLWGCMVRCLRSSIQQSSTMHSFREKKKGGEKVRAFDKLSRENCSWGFMVIGSSGFVLLSSNNVSLLHTVFLYWSSACEIIHSVLKG